ncbi:acyltransferase [Pedobacter aquae]|uniref:Acyltransferase n=1 Tax=Pedobacter aquae TaxID=2605747 RepID=A0A5C0VER0_9SPHI|nr:acyltransferase family protein [Pedobacter aquae]QEK50322.1 acyltransferase [Pedobacter aquae]
MNNPTVLKPIGRITSVDMLRGIAALMVCIFHFTNGNKNYLASGHWFRNFGSYGWAGVEIFFIISGFIIPYSLNQSKYTYQNWKDFLIKRISRIEPPYFITILLILALNYVSTLSPYFKGKDLPIDYFNLALHIGYLNSFFDHPWLNPVFWTLAIEFQFYLLMALIFPLLIHSSTYVRATIVFAYLLSMFFFSSKFIFYYSAYFL